MMHPILLSYVPGFDSNSWVLFVGDNHTTDASPANPGYFSQTTSGMVLEIDNEQNWLIGASKYQSATINSGIFLTKVSKKGEVIWQKALTEFRANNTIGTRTYIDAISFDEPGSSGNPGTVSNIYVTGSIITTGVQNGFLMKLDSDGNILWQQHWAYPNTSYTNVGYAIRFNDDDNPVVFGTYNYTRPYEIGGHLQHGICYAFDANSGTRLTDRIFIGSSGGLGSCYFYDAHKIANHFFIRMNGYYTHSPYVGGRSQSAIIKTNMDCDTLVAIQNTHIGSNSNVYIYEGLDDNGTNLAASTQLNDGAGGGPRQWHIFDTDLNQIDGWRLTDASATEGQGTYHNWCYDGDFIYAAISSSDQVVQFFKFRVTTGEIVWQNKMVGDANNKISSSVYNEAYLRIDTDGYLVYLNTTNRTQSFSNAHVLVGFRIPGDGTGAGSTFGNYTYTTSTDISLTATTAPTGSNPATYASTAAPTDYGDPGVTQITTTIPIHREKRPFN